MSALDATDIGAEQTPPIREPDPPLDAPAGEWLTDKQNRQYVKAVGRRGIVYRSGGETVEEALARDQASKDKKPRARAKTPPKQTGKPPADLKEIEELLSDAFKSPAVPCAMFGDEWAAEHFTLWGPTLAHNITQAAEHSPWLRRKLEAAASGEEALAQLMVIAGVGASIAMYAVPPMVWWLNLPVPEKARQMLGVPDRPIPGMEATGAPGAQGAA